MKATCFWYNIFHHDRLFLPVSCLAKSLHPPAAAPAPHCGPRQSNTLRPPQSQCGWNFLLLCSSKHSRFQLPLQVSAPPCRMMAWSSMLLGTQYKLLLSLSHTMHALSSVLMYSCGGAAVRSKTLRSEGPIGRQPLHLLSVQLFNSTHGRNLFCLYVLTFNDALQHEAEQLLVSALKHVGLHPLHGDDQVDHAPHLWRMVDDLHVEVLGHLQAPLLLWFHVADVLFSGSVEKTHVPSTIIPIERLSLTKCSPGGHLVCGCLPARGDRRCTVARLSALVRGMLPSNRRDIFMLLAWEIPAADREWEGPRCRCSHCWASVIMKRCTSCSCKSFEPCDCNTPTEGDNSTRPGGGSVQQLSHFYDDISHWDEMCGCITWQVDKR